MTPLEINQKIAEIKGYEGYYPWSEKIEFAWELFEEMPRPQLTKGGLSFPYYFCLSEFVEQSSSPARGAPTAPLAICMAWLEWKGIKNYDPT